ncbi:MAG: RNA-binding protein [Candidatus Doudnabacteria bacterium RIFCSPHIGHO2_01_FULL_43_23]|uniref:RNA-binding protein n=1 Tax=Candidatus Doudnabacteria bacterium RIFCSPHIGHO2_01_FULL_43_23 TaxID=1817822 RepID=A0A1F5NTG1_9BACT|nr:MAG: RNA-binding protein [Candidatus Doudnabacteria bacterium RIFCSPHIGHO2_01_FULL_43_23]
MAKKLYVGSLPYETTDEELREHFSSAGAVSSANIIMDKFSGRSKGFGFVEFENDADADKAVEQFNGSELGGRKLVVNEARPMTDRKPRGGGSGGFRGGNGGGGRGGRGGFNRGGSDF